MSDTDTLAVVDTRDLSAVERHAKEVLQQVYYLRRNGGGDEIRWGFIATETWAAWRIAAKAERREAKRRGLPLFPWRMPRGYGRRT